MIIKNALILTLLACCSACSTTTLLKKQELERLSAQLQYLQATHTLLVHTPNPETSGDLSIFVSSGTLNKLLTVADGIAAPIPGVGGATLHVASVRATFTDGLPLVTIAAWAEKPSAHLRLDVSLFAVLEPVTDPAHPAQLLYRVGVRDVVPVLHWGIFQLPSFLFVRQLLHVSAQNYADQLPAVAIPLRSDFDIQQSQTAHNVVVTTDNGGGHLYGTLSFPGFELRGAVIIDNVLYLHDGLHVLAHIQSPSLVKASR